MAVTHFYGVGCAFINLATNTPYPLNDSITSCKNLLAAVPDRCQSAFDDYVTCLNEVQSDARCADCSDEQDALVGCD